MTVENQSKTDRNQKVLDLREVEAVKKRGRLAPRGVPNAAGYLVGMKHTPSVIVYGPAQDVWSPKRLR